MRLLPRLTLAGIGLAVRLAGTLTILLIVDTTYCRNLVWAAQDVPAQYPAGEAPTDPVALLQARLDRGELRLRFDPEHGYLRSVLSHLNIPVSSQALVFSKTSLHSDLISPSTPRALYFNDDVYVGWVQNAPMLEIASVDPQYGTIFYVLGQTEGGSPAFRRLTAPCTSCHAPARDEVPSPLLLVMSVAPAATGEAVGDFQLVTDRSPLDERWGGWYVHPSDRDAAHRGNKIITAGGEKLLGDPAGAALPFDASRYLAASSDIVALMLLSHQTDVHNRISEASHELRALSADVAPARMAEIVEPVVQSMLFSGAARFSSSIRGSSEFTKEFESSGRRDSRGRSLKDLDLDGRLLKYPLSYLIYSDSFDRMPADAREYVYRRLLEVFGGEDQSEGFNHLSNADRAALLEILSETKPEFARWAARTGRGRI